MTAIRQVVATVQGKLLLLTVPGEVYEQRPSEGSSQTKEWVPVDLAGIDGRVVEIVSRPSSYPGPMLARTHDNRLYEQFADPQDRYGVHRWREIEGPMP